MSFLTKKVSWMQEKPNKFSNSHFCFQVIVKLTLTPLNLFAKILRATRKCTQCLEETLSLSNVHSKAHSHSATPREDQASIPAAFPRVIWTLAATTTDFNSTSKPALMFKVQKVFQKNFNASPLGPKDQRSTLWPK